MKDMGLAVMGSGTASGEDRAQEAALQAISSPLLENMNIQGARGVLLNITGGKNLGLHEISEAASIIYEQAEEDAHIILGSVIDENMKDEVTVTIIATGFEKSVDLSPEPTKADALECDTDMRVKATVIDDTDEQTVSQTDCSQDVPVKKESDYAQVSERARNDESLEYKAKEKKPSELINLDDLDIPTFLRNSVEENSKQ